MIGHDWLDADQPHEEAHGAAQVEALLARLPTGAAVLDLGCGSGRVLVPLAAAGFTLTGIDRRPPALERCRDALGEVGAAATLLDGDFLGPLPFADAAFDVVLCLGNTLMTVVDVSAALGLAREVSRVLAPGGRFVIDDCPRDFWPELTEGHWQSGITEDGSSQMLWVPGDAVFSLRHGREVDEDRWAITDDDRRFRLWSDGALALLAAAAGLSVPERVEAAPLLMMSRRSD